MTIIILLILVIVASILFIQINKKEKQIKQLLMYSEAYAYAKKMIEKGIEIKHKSLIERAKIIKAEEETKDNE